MERTMRKAFGAYGKQTTPQRLFSTQHQKSCSSKLTWLATTLGGLYVAHEILDYTGVGKEFCLWKHYQESKGINAEVFSELERVIPKYLGKEFLKNNEWSTLKKEGQFEKYGNDEECRKPVVGTQTATEETYSNILANRVDWTGVVLEEADDFYLIIHTPLPATPLTKGQIDLSIQKDHERMHSTIIPRPNILINILEEGGKIIVLYPEGGLEKRTPDGQAFYKSLLEKYPNQLIDMPISKDSMPDFPQDQIGASAYLLREGQIENFFSISTYQAIKAIDKKVPWAITLGKPEQPKVKAMMKHREELFNVKEMIKFREKLILQEANKEEDVFDLINSVNHSI